MSKTFDLLRRLEEHADVFRTDDPAAKSAEVDRPEGVPKRTVEPNSFATAVAVTELRVPLSSLEESVALRQADDIRLPDPATTQTPASYPQKITHGTDAQHSVQFDRKRAKSEPGEHDEIRALVENLFEFNHGGSRRRVVVFAGVDGDCGSVEVSCRVAKQLARNDHEVCLLDTTLDTRSLLRVLHARGNDPNLDTPQVRRVQFSGGQLSVATRDTLSVAGGLIGEALCESVALLRPRFDFLVVHSLPADSGEQTVQIAQTCDGIVLVIQAGSTRRETAIQCARQLTNSGALVLGTVFNTSV